MSIQNFLIEMLNNQYDEEIIKKIMNGYSQKRKTTFRVNTIKSNIEEIKQALQANSIEYENANWSNEVFILQEEKENKLQELEIYKDGKIYMQSLSSMLPPIILEPNENEDILDMTAAPGGKTTQIAALTKNNAHITACEMNPIRVDRLRYNIEKQGASSVYVMQIDSRKIDDFFSFDKILLDAPCSGSGTLNNDDEQLEKIFTKKLIEKSVIAQTTLLEKALKILKPGKEMIYSTCSILSCENEDVINTVLKRANAKIVPITCEWVKELPLLPTKIEGTLCVCPTKLYEGFFVAKIKKEI